MRAPARSAELSITQPNMCAKGTIPATTSSGPKRGGAAAYWRSAATAPACVWMALLGRPLVPLVLSRSAVASGSPPSGRIGSATGQRFKREQRLGPRGGRRLADLGHRGRVGDRVARAGLAQEGAELAGREQRAGRRQREPGEQGSVGDDREADAVARHRGRARRRRGAPPARSPPASRRAPSTISP